MNFRILSVCAAPTPHVVRYQRLALASAKARKARKATTRRTADKGAA